jgi:YNFM family putative membrane transporter
LGHAKRANDGKGHILMAQDEIKETPDRIQRLVIVITLSTFTGALFISVISFIPLILVDQYKLSKETAGALLGLTYSAGLWAGPFAGFLSDRLGKVPVMLSACFMGGPVIYLLTIIPYGLGFLILLISIGIIVYVRMPVTESYIVGETKPSSRSTILGIYYFCAMEGGGVFTPIIGYLIDHLGFSLTYTIAGASLLIVTLACSIGLMGGREKW